MNKIFRFVALFLLMMSALLLHAQSVNLLWCNDMGRNGYYDQKACAAAMGNLAEKVGVEAGIAVGDIHHFNGIQSVNDPLWRTNYEDIYSHPELMCFWYPVLGNHEYRGNTPAVLDYSKISRRWRFEKRYYTKVFENKGCKLRIVFLDTTPLIDKYRNDSITYPDAHKQSREAELQWLDETLKNAHEDWVIVVGHHPIYAATGKTVDERLQMQKYVMPILHKYKNVAVYGCGHIHNFQYIQPKGDDIAYWVNSAAALSRPVKPVDGTQWCSPSTGFTLIQATKQQLSLSAIDKDGKTLYTLNKSKEVKK